MLSQLQVVDVLKGFNGGLFSDMGTITDIQTPTRNRVVIFAKSGERKDILESLPEHFGEGEYDKSMKGSSVGGFGFLDSNIKIVAKPIAGTRNPLEKEEAAIRDLTKIIQARDDGVGITILLTENSKNDGKILYRFDNIVGVGQVSGVPKADFVLRNNKNNSVCWISHKAAGGAGAFQQYSGITKTADARVYGVISQHREVTDFLNDLSGRHSSVVDSKARYFREIKDKTLINRAIFGPDYTMVDSPQFGIDNCQFIGQGNPILSVYTGRKSIPGISYVLSWSSHMSFNGDVSFFTGDYTPVIGARYTSGRKYYTGGNTYTDVRVLIMPKKLLGPRAESI